MSRTLLLVACLFLCLPTAARPADFLGQSADQWVKQLADKQATNRRSAAFALGRLGSAAESALPQLLDRVRNDERYTVREMAALAIGDIALDLKEGARARWSAVGPMLEAQFNKETDPRVRRGLAYALGAFGPAAAAAVPELQTALADKNSVVRRNAAWALGRIGEACGKGVVGALCERLKDDDPLVRRDAAHALGGIGLPTAQAATEPLLDLVVRESRKDTGDAVVLKAALEQLVNLASDRDKESAAKLYPLLQNDDQEIQRFAAFALANIGGERAAKALAILREALKDEEERIQELAAAALGRLGMAAEPALPDLTAALDSKSLLVRRHAVISIGRVGADALERRNQLIRARLFDEAMATPSPSLTEAMKKPVPRMTRMLKADDEPDLQVRMRVAEALFFLGEKSIQEALPTVIERIKDKEEPWRMRHMCVCVLLNVDDVRRYKADEPLLKILDDLNKDNRVLCYDAARVLAQSYKQESPDKVAPVLLEMLKDTDLLLYEGATARVDGAGTETNTGKATVSDGNGGDGRFMAAEALGWLGKKGNQPNIIKALEAAAKEKDERLRFYAREALQKITQGK